MLLQMKIGWKMKKKINNQVMTKLKTMRIITLMTIKQTILKRNRLKKYQKRKQKLKANQLILSNKIT